MSRHGSLGLVVGVAVVAATPGSARAAACCGTGYGLGQRLAVAERGAVALTERGSSSLGSFDDAGRWIANPTGDHDRESRTELSVLARVGSSVQIGASVPFVYTARSAGELRGAGGGVGDVGLVGRYDFVPVGGRGDLPGVSATLAVNVPTGRSSHRARDLLGADATGLGAFEIRPGVALEKTWWRGWFVIVASSVGLRLPFEGPAGRTIQLGPRWSTVVAGGPSFTGGLGLAVGVQHDREAAPTDAGVVGLGRRRTFVLAVVSYDLDLHWSIVAAGQLDPHLDGLGRNEPGPASATVGLRWARSIYD